MAGMNHNSDNPPQTTNDLRRRETSMNPKLNFNWKDAFLASPGPSSFKSAALLWIKGLCMGSADVIPGVSGGTIALITGIYENLIQAIKSLDYTLIAKLLKFDLKGALAHIHVRFLVSLLLGIGVAILSLARLMNFLLHDYPVFTWSLFFGLIAASILVVGRQVNHWIGWAGISFIAGVGAATIIVNQIPVATPEDFWFIFLCGIIAICAMILPGISGAFILLILGKYEFITATLKNPFLPENLLIIFVFCAGCVIGLLGFSRVLNYFLQKFHNLTIAFLAGLMTGSIQKIWPWKEVLETGMVAGKSYVLLERNIMPPAIGADFFYAVVLAVIGFMAVVVIERLSKKTN
jgi:putative membrane protein